MEADNHRANLFYSNTNINDYDLPETLKEFKSDIKKLFKIDSRLNNEIHIIYISLEKKQLKKNIEVKTEDEYKAMRDKIENQIKDHTVLIEIGDNLNDVGRKKPETFEEEIRCVVERELKNAAENITKCLTSNYQKLYLNSKIQDKNCGDCGELIIGDTYKSAINGEEKYFCEKCSFKINEPMFIIH